MTLTEVVFMGFFLVTFLWCIKLKRNNGRLRTKARDYKRSYNRILKNLGSTYVVGVSSFIESFFEYSEITNYSVQVSQDKIDVKIGDDHHMVKVDHILFTNDPVAALEQARMQWDKTRNF